MRTVLAFLLFALNAHAQPFASLAELRTSMNAVAAGENADAFWNRVLAHRAMPIVFDAEAPERNG